MSRTFTIDLVREPTGALVVAIGKVALRTPAELWSHLGFLHPIPAKVEPLHQRLRDNDETIEEFLARGGRIRHVTPAEPKPKRSRKPSVPPDKQARIDAALKELGISAEDLL